MLFILTSTFESVLVLSGFVLGINSLLAVSAVFVLRYRGMSSPKAYRTWDYPLTPAVYLGLTLWTLTYILLNRTEEGLMGLGVIVLGAVVYLATRKAAVP